MPAILAQIARPVIIWLLQAGATAAVFSVVDQILNALQKWVRDTAGVSDDDAAAWVTNLFVDAITFIGAGALVLHTKLPVTLARRLGFEGSKLTKKAVSAAAEQKIASVPIQKVAKNGGGLIKVLLGIGAGVTSLIWLTNIVPQTLEPGIYQPKQANDVWQSFIGIRPFPEPPLTDSPPPFSRSEFADYAAALETQKVAGINDVFKAQSVPYTRKNLADLVFGIYGNAAADGIKLTTTKIIAEIPKYLIYPGKAPAVTTPAKTSAPAPQPVQNTKVFVGSLGRGTLTAASGFTPRPDDLIVSMSELETALRNNLTPFLASALGRFVYETKVISSVTTKDGFTQKGQAQQVVSGYDKDGKPKYRTVVNKFAVADIYFITENGTRAKAARIVLGPTDAVNFRPTTSDLGNLDISTKNDLITHSLADVSDIKKGGTTTPIASQNEVQGSTRSYNKASTQALSRLFRAGASNGNPPPDQLYADTGKRIYIIPNLQKPGAGIWETIDEYNKEQSTGNHYKITRERLKSRYGIDFDQLPTRNPADLAQQAILAGYDAETAYSPGIGNYKNPIYAAESIEQLIDLAGGTQATSPIGQGPACAAENLSQFFQARGEKLPSVEVRSVLYEQFQLGPRGFYTATAEQNVKLLAKLKEQAGCSV